MQKNSALLDGGIFLIYNRNVLEWWFDIEDKICCVRMEERKPAPMLSFDGGARMRFNEIKALRSGLTYLYITDDGHNVSINDVQIRGERYVSLYCDGKLIKEYNVRAERLKKKFDENPDIYISPRKFLGKMFAIDSAVSLFCAILAVAFMSSFGVFVKLLPAVVTAAALFFMFVFFTGGVFSFFYAAQRGRMEKYSIVPGMKGNRKRTRKKTIGRRAR